MHPAWMAVSLGLAGLALRAGLRLRRTRRRGHPRGAEMVRRHTRLAKPAVALVVVGFALGLASMAWLRHRTPFETAHAALAATALALFATAAVLGRRLERGRSRAVDTHALAGSLAVLAAAAAAVAGLDLLP